MRIDSPISTNAQITGSFSGSFYGDGAGISGVTAEWDGSHNGDASITGSLNVSANVIVGGTVDGRDIATDGAKLDGIETGATADQTAAEIKTAYESNADTNAFDDAAVSKLAGIESGATADQTGAEIKTAYEGEANTNAFTDAEKTKLAGLEAGAEVNVVTSVASKTGDVSLVKGDVGLGNVDNTSDADKPISTATQTALDGKQDAGSFVTTTSSQALSSAANALTLVGNTLTLSRGDSTTDTIDLSAYLDEDSRSISSGVLNGGTGIVTFTRDDASTFTLDLSDLLDDTNLVTSVNGRNGVVTTTLADYSITATAAEINKLDGVTATTAELNYVDGVTSNIQTQLNGKQAAGTYNTVIGTDSDISYTGATVLSAMTMTDGVVQSHSSRTLTLANLGYTGATNANYITNNNQLTNGAGYTTYSANQTLNNNSNVHFEGLMVGQTSGATANTIRCVGDVVAYYSSDAQFKDNVETLEGALDKVKAIRGVRFDWNDKQDVYEGHDIGVIAQEVEAVLPELVHHREYNDSKAVDYAKLTAVLIEAVKELAAKVDELSK